MCSPNSKVFIQQLFQLSAGRFRKRETKCDFDNVLINSPLEIICYASALMNYCAGLSKKELQDLIQDVAKLLVIESGKIQAECSDNEDQALSAWMLVCEVVSVLLLAVITCPSLFSQTLFAFGSCVSFWVVALVCCSGGGLCPVGLVVSLPRVLAP